MATYEEGKRIVISKQENWYITKGERDIAQRLMAYIRTRGKCMLTDLYIQIVHQKDVVNLSEQEYKELYSQIEPYKRYMIKCVVLVLWKMNKVSCKYNNGYCLIKPKHTKTQFKNHTME